MVATKVYSLLIPTERRNYADYIVELIAFSMFYLALFFWLVALVNRADIRSNAVLYNFLVLLTVFIIPAVLGWIGCALRQAAWVRRLIGTVTHPIPSAWDYVFSRGETYWVRFHFKSGERVGGYYGTKSFASAYPQPPELYVQELWRLDKDGRFMEKDKRTAGGYIRVEDCQMVEFLAEERKEESGGSEKAQIQEGGYQPLVRKGYQPTRGEPIDRIPPQGISAIIPVESPSSPGGDTSNGNTPPELPPSNKVVSSEETK